MVEMTFIEPSGERRKVKVDEGESLMRAARNAGVEGIIGECGGCVTCGTCHVYVESGQYGSLPDPSTDESNMIETLLNARHNSRLSCQLRASLNFSGLQLTVASKQG